MLALDMSIVLFPACKYRDTNFSGGPYRKTEKQLPMRVIFRIALPPCMEFKLVKL